jgi:iron complex outermembrane receptor protein
LQPVTTTVVVRGEVKDDYLPDAVSVGTLDGAALKETPLSATVVTRDLLNDQAARLLSDVVKNDASIGDDYVPVGYYGDYEIRGFPIDLATGLEINGMTIAGEQDVPLENKERVEFLKGIAGVESGVASAGGLINYVTKRPAAVEAVDLATDQRGTAYGAVDLGRIFGSRKQVGARINLAGERIASYMNDTDGWRAMGAGAADWKLTSKAILKGDFEYQHKTERDGSGFQLLSGTTVPDINRIYPSTMLGDQPWGPPDTYDTFNTGARFDYELPRNWLAFAAASFSHSLIQDNVIYAYGSSIDANGNADCPGAPNAPAYFFCPDGTYGIYDYRDPGELRIDGVAEAMVTGHVRTLFSQRSPARSAACRRAYHRAGRRGVCLRWIGEHLSTPGACPHRKPARIRRPARIVGRRSPVFRDCTGQDSSSRAHSVACRRTRRFTARQQLLPHGNQSRDSANNHG